MNMTNDNPKDTLEIDVNAIPLDELIIAIGGVLFSGAELQEIDTILLTKLIDLLQNEINLRELGMDMPTDETVH
jgi:hypothetical protein|tara:strand:- start:1668 stop:1889 length:222 start_codon:yes stop_codon:yes gene_type:complete